MAFPSDAARDPMWKTRKSGGRAPRLLVLTDRYPPYYTGGYEIACRAIAESLERRGWKIFVLTSMFGVSGRRRDGNVWRALHRPQDAVSMSEAGSWELTDHVVLNAVLRLWRPDAIYAWCLRQLYPSLHRPLGRRRIPVVFNIADAWLPGHLADGLRLRELWFADPKTSRAAIRRLALPILKPWLPTFKSSYTLADLGTPYVISCSKFREAQHLDLGLPAKDATVIYNGVDISRFNGTVGTFDDLRLLLAGRLVPEKGAETALLAVARLVRLGIPRVTLTIAGVRVFPWDYPDRLLALAKTHGLEKRVTLIEDVDNASMPELYRRHNVLLFPSTIMEGLPMSVLEAMACGLLVVGTTGGGTGELLVDGQTGHVVFPGDHAGLADALARVLQDPLRSRTLATEAQRRVKAAADLNVITDQTDAYLKRVIDGSKAS